MPKYLIALAGLLVAVILLPHSVSAAGVTVSNVRITNLTSVDFSVAWDTDSAVTGSMQYYTDSSCATAASSALPESPSDGVVHLDDAGGALTPSTSYWYKLAPDTSAACRGPVTTFASDSINIPPSVNAAVTYSQPGCSNQAGGVLVTVSVTQTAAHGGMTTLLLAQMTDPVLGTVSIAMGTRDSSGNYVYPQAGDTINEVADGGGGNMASQAVTFTSDGQILPTLCLPVSPGTTAAAVSHLAIHRSGVRVRFVWRMGLRRDVIAFNLYAGRHRLNTRPIHAHASPVYRYITRIPASLRHSHLGYSLHVLLSSGRQIIVRSG